MKFHLHLNFICCGGHGCDHIAIGFTSTYGISTYDTPWKGWEFDSC